MKRQLLTCMLMLFGAFSLMAQNKVTGRITDNSGQGVIGASVMVKGTGNGVVVDRDGLYEIASCP